MHNAIIMNITETWIDKDNREDKIANFATYTSDKKRLKDKKWRYRNTIIRCVLAKTNTRKHKISTEIPAVSTDHQIQDMEH